jgi:hypothetical protein
MPAFIFRLSGRLLSRNLYFLLRLVLLSFSTYFPSSLYAQLIITSPVNNQVLQQDNDGLANLPVTGYAHFPYTRIKALLVPAQNNPHQQKEYAFTGDQLRQGFLYTLLQAETGWYQLIVIGYGTGGVIDSARVDRVGVGEVFLVAGNSNAMGLPDLGTKSTSDQVVSFNATNKTLNQDNITVAPDEPMPKPVYTPISAKNNIFPSGETSWYWGELGEMLSKKRNTPVLFLNAGWAAANSENYRDGALGKDAFNIYVGKTWPNRQPYTNLVNTLRYFNAELGLRAILWSHGENDAQLNYTEDAYFKNIKTTIENSRKDSGYPASWIIAKNSSSFTLPTPTAAIINAQNRLAAFKDFKTFSGPDLDTIQIPRPAHGHFENIPGGIQGLTQAATAWNRALTDSLFHAIIPLQPRFAIHAGLPPARVYPGAVFTLPYQITGISNQSAAVKAELLDESGKFVRLAGTGTGNLLTIRIPADLGPGRYQIRVSSIDPVLTGSSSGLFTVSKSYQNINYIHSIASKRMEKSMLISWHVAANTVLTRMTVQKTTDGETYADLESFETTDNEMQSHVYSHLDENADEGNVFYRIKMEDKNGETSYSALLAAFQEGTPPDFVVFPNPVTKQYFYLRFSKSETNIQYTLFDTRGREHAIEISDNEVIGLLSVRPVNHLPSGNYILRVTTETGSRTQNIFIVE